MGKIESDIGSSTFKSQPLRQWTVNDSTRQDEQFDVQSAQNTYTQQPVQHHITPEEVMQLRQQKLDEANRVGQVGRQRVEHLLGIGRIYTDIPVEYEGVKTVFTLRTLKGKEMRHLAHVTQEAAKAQSTDIIYQSRGIALGYALHAIDGVDADVVLNVRGMDPNAIIEARRTFLEEMDENILTYIYEKYNVVVKEASAKYSITTPEAAKEVSEDIKKSGEGS